MDTELVDLKWRVFFKHPDLKKKFWIGVITVTCILVTFPFFFQFIEQRTGPVLKDFVLEALPAQDVSIPIFAIIWATALLFLWRSIQSPYQFMVFIYAYILVTFSRFATIYFFPLDPPPDLIPLVDPIANQFYGKTFITKDLFYSGHTSTQCLLFLCFRRKFERLVGLFCTIAIGFLVLVQHVHYTVDVLAAPLFTWVAYRIARYIVNSTPGSIIEPIEGKRQVNRIN